MLINRSALRLIPYRLRKIISTIHLMPSRVRKLLDTHVCVSLAGQELMIPIGVDGGLQNVLWSRSWKTEIIERLVDVDKGGFVDVGANVGQTLLDLHLTHPGATYVGFEPNITCAHYLKDLIRANDFQSYLIVPVGLADKNKIVPLYNRKDAPADLCGTIISDLRPGLSYDIDLVPCFRFDDIRQSLGLGNVGFVKIDVEGAELDSLIGMRVSIQEFKPLILCEVLFTDNKADLSFMESRNDRLMQLLTDLRYEVLQLVKSVDNTHVVDIKRIRVFPSAYWTFENKDLCDYLFVPSEKETHVLNALLAEK